MLEKLKKAVLAANLELPRRNLVIYSWGNVSGIDRENGYIVIKPAGIPYDVITLESLSVVDLNGRVIEGPYKPAVDLPTHLVLYHSFPEVNGIVHTHSTYATIWAQACRFIPCLGTTHADYFNGPVPCTRVLSKEEIAGDYEMETGKVIVNTFKNLEPSEVSAVLVANHGPFVWGKDPLDAVHKGVVLEEIAKMALGALSLSPELTPISKDLLQRHFYRMHGPNAYFDNDFVGLEAAKQNLG
jgi:L-ribulose-5-phosphate 4-epimerase